MVHERMDDEHIWECTQYVTGFVLLSACMYYSSIHRSEHTCRHAKVIVEEKIRVRGVVVAYEVLVIQCVRSKMTVSNFTVSPC